MFFISPNSKNNPSNICENIRHSLKSKVFQLFRLPDVSEKKNTQSWVESPLWWLEPLARKNFTFSKKFRHFEEKVTEMRFFFIEAYIN